MSVRCIVIYATTSMGVAEFDSRQEADAFIEEESNSTGGQFVLITLQGKPPKYKVETWL